MKIIPFFRIWLVCLASALVACGGGGDDEESESEVEDADATGLWFGTDTRDGGFPVPVVVIVAPGGEIVPAGSFFSVSPELYLSGVGDTFANSFSADADGWPSGSRTAFPDNSTKAQFSLTGSVFTNSTIDGSYSGGGESGTLDLSYDSALTNKGASLTTVAGSYVTDGGGALAITSGEITYNNANAGPNCIGNGTIDFDDSTINVYHWEMVFSGCDLLFNGSAGGLGFISNADSGGTNNRLLLFGVTHGAPPSQIPLAIAATK